MRSLDFFNDINKRWASKREVKKICGCSEEEAYQILMELDWKARELGMSLPNRKDSIYVPMCLFLEYIGNDRVDRIMRYHNSLCEFYGY